MLTIIDSPIVGRAWQMTVFIIIGFASFAFISQPNILSNKIIRVLLVWGMYVSFINLLFAGNTEFGYFNTFIDVIWFPSVFVLFYSIFICDKFGSLYNKLVKAFPLFYFILFFLVSYKMLFHFGSIYFGVLIADEINTVFWILLLVPFAFLINSRFLKYIILFLTFIIVLASTKRSATIAISIVVGMSLINDFFVRKKALRSIPTGIILLLILVSIFNETISKVNINVLDRFQETNIYEESRMDFLKDSWEKYQNKSLLFNIIGSGHRSTGYDRGSDMLSKTSHNDFFEVLYNYGIIGLIFYFYFVWQITKRLILLKRIGGKYFQSYLASYIIFIVMSMVSHLVIYPTYYAFLLVFWAMTENKINNLICVRMNEKLARTI
jgi:hypothetical protein